MKSRLPVLLAAAIFVMLASGLTVQAGSTKMWSTETITTISHSSFPHIEGKCLVWRAHGGLEGTVSGSGDWEIFLYDMEKQLVIQVTDDDYDDISPRTDGDYVVWQKHDRGLTNPNRICLYDLYEKHGENPPGGRIISKDDSDNYAPQIAAGWVVWTSQQVSHFFEPGETMLYDAKNLSGPDLISDSAFDCASPRISSETVIWVQGALDGTTSLFIYDLTGENPQAEPAPEGYVWPYSPQTDGNLTVSIRHDGHDREIFVYDIDSRKYYQITDNKLEDTSVSISENYIAWVAGEGEASEIYLALYEPAATDADPGAEGAEPGTSTGEASTGSSSGQCFIDTAANGLGWWRIDSTAPLLR